jgi:hypothetical protein
VTARERVCCRRCGLRYAEDRGDPCSGLCASCFERGLREISAALLADTEDERVPAREWVPRHVARLRGLGVTEEHVGYIAAVCEDAAAGGWRRPV